MIIGFKYFDDSLSIALMLVSGCEFFCAKHAKCSLTFIK